MKRSSWLPPLAAAVLAAAGVCTAAVGPPSTAPASQPRKTYQPNWESLDSRPLPKWFNEAKFGIFIVWGPYSVPAWTDRGYAEWYWKKSQRAGSATWKFHRANYGADFPYENFAPLLTAELWDPNAWADLFVRAGAKYVAMTANYHDGFCLWPSPYARTVRTDKWNAAVVGPKRDLLGEMFAAGTKRGLKMGIYYSLYEWYHPLWLKDRKRYVTEHLHPQFKDVVTKHKPWFIFLDGEWEMDYRAWRSLELAAWLFNASPCRDYVVTNDRWGKTRGRHGSVYESEYGGGRMPPTHPWQEDRGIGHSYGYNRNETIDDYDTPFELIRMLSRVCGNGGNLLLDVGPTADGRIPVIMQDRLVQIGKWLKANGEAIYGSRASPFWPLRLPWGTCTYKPGRLFVHVWGRPAGQIALPGLVNKVTACYRLGDAKKAPLAVRRIGRRVVIERPPCLPAESVTVLVVEIEGEPAVDRAIHQAGDGSITLPADACLIHGRSPLLETRGGKTNVGYWGDPRDWLSWELRVTKAGAFQVVATYACAKGAGSSEFVLSVGRRKLDCKTEETGSWEKFVPRPLGQVRIDAPGDCRLTIRPKAKPKWRSMGLRSIVLRPVE